jgi:putative ABC transport system permease protein
MMSAEDLTRTAMGAIRQHPLRSALTALGVIIGVASVIAMTSIGLGAQSAVTAQIQGLGSNLLIIMPGNFRQGGVNLGAGTRPSLTDDDVAALQSQLTSAAVIASGVRTSAQIVYEGANWATSVYGVTPGYLEARDWSIASGRFFDDRETRQGRKIAVIGATVKKELFGDNDPIGARIRVGSTPLEVVGVLTAKGQTGFGQDQDDVILAPLDAVRSRLKGRSNRVDQVDQIYVKAASVDDLDKLQQDATDILRQRHRRAADEADDFTVQNMAQMLEAGKSATQTFTYLLAAVAAVSLVVGGVGIMNIMLVAVTERTREIGLRMALGARRGDILRQFALESTVLSAAGGVAGLLLGAGIGALVAKIAGWPAALDPTTMIGSIVFSGLLGLGFGAYPAYRAAQLDPIEALRRD